jgi:hypothetical protein
VFNAKPFQLVFMGSERGKPFIALHGWHGLMGAMTIGNYACHFQRYAANIPIIMSAPANPNPIDQALLTALDAAFAAIAAIDSPTFTGTPALPTQSVTDNSTPAVNSAWVAANLVPCALIADVPTAYTSVPAVDGTASAGSATTQSRGHHVHPSDTAGYAGGPIGPLTLLANPTLAGAPPVGVLLTAPSESDSGVLAFGVIDAGSF